MKYSLGAALISAVFLTCLKAADEAAMIETYLREGDYAAAEPLLEAMAETSAEAPVLLSLGMVRDALGDVDGAIEALERARGKESGFGGDIADALGRAYQHAYRFGDAEEVLKEAVSLRGTSPHWQRVSQDHLGLLYLAWGRHEEAGALFRKSLAETPKDAPDVRAQRHGYLGRLALAVKSFGRAREHFAAARHLAVDTWGEGSPEAASFAANEGFAAFRSGDLAAAREQFLAALERLPEVDRPEVLSNLGQLALAEGNPEDAVQAFTHAMRLLEARFGGAHPTLARARINLGSASMEMGENRKAEKQFAEAWKIALSTLTAEHALTVQALNSLALTEFLSGEESDLASDRAFEAASVGERLMRRAIAACDTRQRLNYRSGTDLLSLPASIVTWKRPASTQQLADLLVRIKGLATPTKILDPDIRELQLKIDQLRLDEKPVPPEDLARLGDAVDGSLPPGPESWQEVQKLLPEGGVLVDFLAFTDYGAEPFTATYGAMVTAWEGEPTWVKLGTDAKLERWLGAYGRKVRGTRPGALTLHGVLRGLSEFFWDPVEAVLPKDTKTLVLAPDAGLHFLPFATLLGGEGDFLCERFPQAVTIGSARDLLPQPAPSTTNPWMIFAVSDYPGGNPLPRAPRNKALGEEISRMPDLRGALREAKLVGARSPSKVISGKRADEAAVAAVESPAVLHLVAHGFYLGEEPEPVLDFDTNPAPYYESGVVLAGALAAEDRANDNILFTEEAAGLDLENTWIATVSSCSSGLGTTASGEGVVGLRRALSSAGARDVLLTLWPVSDSASPDFMRRFYQTAVEAQNAPGALWALQREELRRFFPRGETDEAKLARAVFQAGPYILSHRGAVGDPVPRGSVAAPGPERLSPVSQVAWRTAAGFGLLAFGLLLVPVSLLLSRR